MYIAMNRFKIKPSSAEAFELVWKNRKRRLDECEGYLSFHFLKGDCKDDHMLYISYTTWESREAFDAWTRSEQFKDVHSRTATQTIEYLGHPQFEGFETLLTEVNPNANNTAEVE